MKKPFIKLTVSFLLALLCLQGHALEIADLSLTSTQPCKTPPKAPPYKLLHKKYQTYSIPTNAPFDHTVDINGDGWCDWVSRPSELPYQSDMDEPPMEDFIFLGTPTGWRKFGNMKKFRSDTSGLNREGGWLSPDSSAFGFLDVRFIYANGNPVPYVVILAPIFDNRFPLRMEDIGVLQWNNTFDMLHDVNNEVKNTIIEFLRKQNCEPGKKYEEGFTLTDVICSKQ